MQTLRQDLHRSARFNCSGLRSHATFGLLRCALLLCGLSHQVIGQAPPAPNSQLVLTGGTVYTHPAASPIINGVVVIGDDKIVAVGRRGAVRVPQGARILNCSGHTITAGFWNSHVHFFERKWADAASIPAPELAGQLQTMLTRYGFTSVFDLGSPWANTRRLRARIESGEVPGPRIRSTGEGLLGKGWMPAATVLRVLGVMTFPTPEVADAAEGLAAAQKLLDGGADGLKLHATAQFPPFTPLPSEAMRAAVAEAQRRNKPVFVHPTNPDGLRAAVRSGADIIAHTTPQSGAWDEDVVTTMRQAKVALIPTLKIWKYVLRHDRASLGESSAKASTSQLRAWLAAGGVVLFGTDVGGMDDYDPSEEYALMAEAGMTFRQILASLTTAPAEKFGAADWRGQLGKIVPGFIADLVVLHADPARDVRAWAEVRYTIRDGKVIYQAAR